MIKVKDVKKIYSKDVTLGPYNIEIKKSGITSLIGPNGAGKSTLLLMIGRLLEMNEGIIEVANYDVYDTDSKDIAKILSILKQENHFISRLTVRQLIGFRRFPYSKGHLTNEDQEIIDKYIKFLDLKPLENRFLDELSGGKDRELILRWYYVKKLTTFY
ncbi:ATP-binding cassette domain-containing protein [Helcococcus kunzii]|uniref:ATP-binding cassette domain-containing protein n=1 Tax=Helcococcus kunzii TaxID=40091 RepID=UPI0020165B5A|nr:ATP-binding cassette domain-containing protein [Helcococcus kunzii]